MGKAVKSARSVGYEGHRIAVARPEITGYGRRMLKRLRHWLRFNPEHSGPILIGIVITMIAVLIVGLAMGVGSVL